MTGIKEEEDPDVVSRRGKRRPTRNAHIDMPAAQLQLKIQPATDPATRSRLFLSVLNSQCLQSLPYSLATLGEDAALSLGYESENQCENDEPEPLANCSVLNIEDLGDLPDPDMKNVEQNVQALLC